MLAGFISSFWGLKGVILINMLTFSFAFISLVLFIRIPSNQEGRSSKNYNLIDELKEGLEFLLQNKCILYLILHMSCLTFFSRLTYENILSPMILSRSGGNETTLGFVCAILGVGGILGGYLAEYVFEPFMQSSNTLALFLSNIVGTSYGSGMAIMFLCTGILGFISSIVGYVSLSSIKKEKI